MVAHPDFRDVHQVAEIFRQLRGSVKSPQLSKEAERILGATAPEDEFMAIATWSGRCSLIHKLAPDKYPPKADQEYKVPDLLAVFEYQGRSIPALVEVKSTYTPVKPGRIKLAKIGPAYKQRLKKYGDLLGLPVLIAQQIRPPGLWFLVALETIGLDGTATADLGHDLSGVLLGAFSLTFRAGTKFVIRLEKERVISEKEFVGVVRGAHWETASGKIVTKTQSPMILLFGLGDIVEKQKDDGRFLTMVWEIPAEMAFTNYQALRVAIVMDRQLREARFPWLEMLRSGKFPVKHASIEAAQQDSEFFNFMITTRPKQMPNFLSSYCPLKT